MVLKVKNREEYLGNYGMDELFQPPDFHQCIRWDDHANICWSDNPFTWDEVCMVLDLSNGGLAVYETWDEKKKKQFITLYCKVKSQKTNIYNRVDKITKEKPEKVNVGAKEINFVVESVLSQIKVEVEI